MNEVEWPGDEVAMTNDANLELPQVRLASTDRRENLRLRPSALSALVFIGAEKYIVSIRDISKSGVKVVNAPPELSEGQEFSLLAGLNGPNLLQVRCRASYLLGSPARREVGAQFMDMHAEDTQQLLRYLETLGMEILYR